MIQTFNIQPARIRIRPRDGDRAVSAQGLGSRSIAELGLWLLCLALILRMTVFIRQRSLTDFAVVDFHATIQILIVAGCLFLVLLSRRLRPVWKLCAGTASIALMLYYLFGAISSAWSAKPEFSFYRALEAISQITAVFVALSYAPGFIAAERRALSIVMITAFMGVFAVLFTYGLRSNLIYWHTNQYTVPAMLALVYASGELLSGRKKNRQYLLALGGIGFVVLIIGTSSASFISALCGILVALLLARSRGKNLLLFSLLLSLIVLFVGASAIGKLVFYGKSQQNIEHLNGRLYIWKGYLEKYGEHPVLGQGFAVPARISSHTRSTNTHNAALSALLGTGLIGMAVVLLFLRRFVRDASRSLRLQRPGAVGCIAALTAGLVNSMSVAFLGEGWMMSSLSFFCLLALFSMFVVPKRSGAPASLQTARS